MKIGPFEIHWRERRSGAYTDALVSRIVDAASGSTSPLAAATAAVEAVAGILARSFAAAAVSGPEQLTEALTPGCLAMMGRAMIRCGDVVFLIEVQRGRLRLVPVESHDVFGGYDPAGWTYQAQHGRARRGM